MGVNWTKEQQQVIDARSCNVLVSAAAGSGKTAVLVARILALITDEAHPVDIDRLLVVTFTRAAAGEMRERISRAIEERLLADPDNEHLQRQSILLHNARISTIDGFCTYVIQNYFYKTDLDPGYRIAEEGELKQLRGDVMEELLEEAYAEADPAFLALSEMLSPGRHDRRLDEIIQRVYDFSMASPDPDGWLADCVESCDADTPEALQEKTWVRETVAEADRMLPGVRALAEENLRLASRADGPGQYLPMAQADLELVDALEACGSYTAYQDVLSQLQFMRLAGGRRDKREIDPELQERFKENREELKKFIQELQKSLFADTPEEVLRQLALICPHIAELTRLAAAFGARFAEKKRMRNLVDFPDLEHYALRILLERTEDGWRQTDVARELAGRFAEIMIDEYQDSNLLQEYLLGAVAGGADQKAYNRFMVGDMKQSIYGFRMARPELFLEKYETYAADSDAEAAGESNDSEGDPPRRRRITLGRNFRSRPEVLDFSNAVFARLMQPDLGGIRYDAEAALYPGAAFPDAEDAETPSASPYRAELLLLDKQAPEFDDDRSRETMIEAEAALAAQRIHALRRTGQVCDRTTGALRPVAYRDIVILLRSASGAAGTYARVLQGMGIPAYAASRKGYFSALEIVTVLNYLRILDNPRQAIPFAAILRSPICGCTDEELARLRSMYRELPVYEACRRYLEENGEPDLQGVPADAPGEAQAGRNSAAPERRETAMLTGQGAVTSGGQDRSAGTDDPLRHKLHGFFAVYDALRAQLPLLRVHEVVQRVLDDTGYGLFAAAMPAGEQRAANLRMLVETAVAYEQTSYHGLFRFVRYIEQLESYNVDYGEVNLFGEGEDTVRIMTIHKSKGLEFPIVFLCGLGGRFNQMDLNDAVVQHASFGIGLDAVDLELRVKRQSLLRRAVRTVIKRDMLGEELRVLYVALTRAREKLIMTAVVDDLEKRRPLVRTQADAAGDVVSYRKRVTARSYLDWILAALTPETPVTIRVTEPAELGAAELEETGANLHRIQRMREIAEQAEVRPTVYHRALHTFLQEKEAFSYPYEALAALPAKLSVSEVKRRSIEAMEEEKGEELYREEPVVPLVPEFVRAQEERDAEQESVRGAARGTLYHRVLAALNLPQIDTEEDIQDQIAGMVRAGRLTEGDARAISTGDLMRFAAAPIGQRMRAAQARGTLVREQPFVIDIPAGEIDPAYASDEPILIQGIIDAYFEEDGRYVIVDYKTDRVFRRDGADLAEKYRAQLMYYRRALEQILDVQVSELYLYSTALGREIRVQN